MDEGTRRLAEACMARIRDRMWRRAGFAPPVPSSLVAQLGLPAELCDGDAVVFGPRGAGAGVVARALASGRARPVLVVEGRDFNRVAGHGLLGRGVLTPVPGYEARVRVRQGWLLCLVSQGGPAAVVLDAIGCFDSTMTEALRPMFDRRDVRLFITAATEAEYQAWALAALMTVRSPALVHVSDEQRRQLWTRAGEDAQVLDLLSKEVGSGRKERVN